MSKAKVQYVVHCVRHGKDGKNWLGKQVVVPAPESRKAFRTSGCPACRAEATLSAQK